MEEASSSEDLGLVEREYATTNLITPQVRNVSEVEVEVKTSSEVDQIIESCLAPDTSTQLSTPVVDPKAILGQGKGRFLPTSFFEADRVRDLARIALRLYQEIRAPQRPNPNSSQDQSLSEEPNIRHRIEELLGSKDELMVEEAERDE
jgi:hypothetical protein